MRESAEKKSLRVKKVIKLLKKYYPNAECALHHETPMQLLIATILSAQCTDERVNQVTPHLFSEFPTARDLAGAPLSRLEHLIHSTGFFRNKAKNIKECCKALVDQYDGEVPKNLPDLVSLPGVGRKTANVVLGVAFQIPSGIVVDTHVTRLSNRLGFVVGENAVVIEKKLMPLVPQEHWIEYSHLLITHGRQVCKARTPACQSCFLSEHCPQKIT